ncbi:hypothetical protein ACQ4PT_021737 [Festuca glaucescens]
MAHILRSVLFPIGGSNREQARADIASSSSSNPAPCRRETAGSTSGIAGGSSMQHNEARYNNPPPFFTQNQEDDDPAPSGFVADSILRRFDLNQTVDENATFAPSNSATHEENAAPQFRPGPQSAASGNVADACEENGEEISSQPVVSFVGMMFEDLEVAKEVYNDYAFKLGFGIHIGNTKYSQARGATKEDILSRVFECVHAGKPINAAKKSTSKGDAPVESDMSIFSAHKSNGKQAAMMMDVKDTRQRNKRILDRYMTHRWSIAATTPAPDPGTSGAKFSTPGTNTLKYNSLCRKLNRLAADACVADDTYAVVTDMIAETRRTVVAMHRARNATHEEKEGENAADPPQAPHDMRQQQQEQDNEQNRDNQQQQQAAQDTPATSNLRNPTIIKPKGRPSEKEQRRKPLIELRDEANKKRRKKAE